MTTIFSSHFFHFSLFTNMLCHERVAGQSRLCELCKLPCDYFYIRALSVGIALQVAAKIASCIKPLFHSSQTPTRKLAASAFK